MEELSSRDQGRKHKMELKGDNKKKWRKKNGERTEDKTKEGPTVEWIREGSETERREGMFNEP